MIRIEDPELANLSLWMEFAEGVLASTMPSKTLKSQEHRGENNAVPKSTSKTSLDMKASSLETPTASIFSSTPRKYKDICGNCWENRHYDVLEANDRVERIGKVSEGACQDCGERPAEIRVRILPVGSSGTQQ